MALIDITPVMTSNTAPSPYVVSQSTSYGTATLGWRAFDNNQGSNWQTANNTRTGNLTINLATVTEVDAFGISVSSVALAPVDFVIQGSNNGTTYDDIVTNTSVTDWVVNEYKIYELTNSVSYQYYRLNVTKNNGGTVVSIGEFKLYKKEDEVPIMPNSLRYTLPFGSKTRLDNLTSDLTYMIATESDDGNEGTLRVVDKNGKFILAKAGMANADVLFDGVANTKGTIYNTTKPISDYKYLLVIGGVTNGTTNVDILMIPTDRIKSFSSTVEQFSIGIFSSSSYYYRVAMSFVSESSFTITNSSLSGWTTPVITNIYGIK